MKVAKHFLIALTMLAAAPLPMRSQALTVGPSGALVQEKPAPAIPPEDQPTKQQLAKLFDVMRIRQQVQSVKSMVPAIVEGQIREQAKAIRAELPAGSRLTEEQRKQLDEIARKYLDKAVNIYPVEEMLDDMTAIYQRHISREDVDAMTAFYSSPPGQHLLDAQPVIAQEFMPLVMTRVTERTKTMTVEMMHEASAITRASKPAAK